MSIKVLQNFYKTTLLQSAGSGTGVMYVGVKPTPTSGWLVISPANATLREIVAYTSTGTDGTGDYVVTSVRGVGGTTAQSHSVNEPVRMNFTAQHQQEISDLIDLKAPLASPTFTGVVTVPTPSGDTDAANKEYADTKIPKTDIDTDGALTANSDTKVASQKATKTYADTKIPKTDIDTDTTLAADSDTKVASQKATKAYADGIAIAGGTNASETVRGVVEEATDAEVTAGTATGSTGAKLFVTPAKLATRTTAVLASYQLTNVYSSGLTTKSVEDANTTQTIAHGLGRAPKVVRFTATSIPTDSGDEVMIIRGIFDASGQRCIETYINGEGTSAISTDASAALKLKQFPASMDEFQTGTVSVDATNISIAWVKTSTPTGNVYTIMWEAEA